MNINFNISILENSIGKFNSSIIGRVLHSKINNENMEEDANMIYYKIGIIFLLFTISLFFGLLPIKVSYFSNNFKLIGIANAFSGGIFLSVALLHLLPESTEMFNEYLEEMSQVNKLENFNNFTNNFTNNNTTEEHSEEHGRHFPISFLFAFVGYTLILMVEKIIFDSHSHHMDAEEEDEEQAEEMSVMNEYKDLGPKENPTTVNVNVNMNNNYNITFKTGKTPRKTSMPLAMQFPIRFSTSGNNHNEEIALNIEKINKQLIAGLSSKHGSISVLSRGKRDKLNSYFESFKIDTAEKKEENFKNLFSNTGKLSNIVINNQIKNRSSQKRASINSFGSNLENLLSPKSILNPILSKKNSILLKRKLSKEDENILKEMERPAKESVTSLLLLLALSIHSCFEGIAIGLQGNASEVFYMFLAISFHKWVEALSIGINLNNSKIERSYLFKFIILFSLTTPIGMLIGMFLSGTSEVVEATFLSISAGTFLYISASEIVIEEFSISKYKKEKFVALIVGAFIILILTLLEHNH